MTEKEKVGRRDYVKTAAAGVVGLAVGAAAGYFAAPVREAPGETVTKTVETTKTVEVTTTVGPTPGPRDKLFYSFSHNAITIDPHKIMDDSSTRSIVQMYDPLVTFGGVYPDTVVLPHLAWNWESPDGKTWTFYIRKGVKFHDGSELDAEAVKYSFTRALIMKQGHATVGYVDFLPPENIEVVDKYTIRFTLSRPLPFFLGTLGATFVVNSRLVEQNKKAEGPFGEHGDFGTEWLEQNDAGSGPYTLIEHRTGEHTTFERFPDYWEGWSTTYFDEFEYNVIPEFPLIRSKLIAKETDMSATWMPEEILNELAASPTTKVIDSPTILYPLDLKLNTKNEFLSNVHVRRALSYALNYETVITKIYGGHDRLYGPVPMGYKGAIIPENHYDYDLAKAKSELEASGFAPGEVTVQFLFPAGEESRRETGLLLRDGAAEAGINVEMLELEWHACVELISDPESAGWVFCVVPTLAHIDIDAPFFSRYYSKLWKEAGGVASYNNCNYYDNPHVDDLIEKARAEWEWSKRAVMYEELQNLLVEEAPEIWAAQLKYRCPMTEDVEGWVYPSAGYLSLGFRVNRLWRSK